MLRTFCPVVFEGFRAGAPVDSMVCRLIGFVRNDALGILQVQDTSLDRCLVRRHEIF